MPILMSMEFPIMDSIWLSTNPLNGSDYLHITEYATSPGWGQRPIDLGHRAQAVLLHSGDLQPQPARLDPTTAWV